jgi:type III restriction enzyme
MNKNAIYVRNRLSLRTPQAESLDILTQITDLLSLEKSTDLAIEFDKIKSLFPTLSDFERTFPSVCFALATGVGKTRLMGAFISYLYLEKKLKNFFVLAPNLTVYNKLIADFTDTTSPKYVFQGIGELVHNQPQIITGDNYDQLCQGSLFESDVQINVFNISKINSETRGGNAPRIKRLSEYLGDSYFDYLANKKDLVLLMDESHHYRADRGMEVLNELNPILGLELTATPQVEKGNKSIKFKNVVYEYSLAKAIQDGYVKEPAVATRQNFNSEQYTLDELDRIKLEDGLRIHEDTKVNLDIYARDNKVRQVKPFVLVVAKDTEHAGKLKELIQSHTFFNGYYADKVMEVHSNQSGEEKEENVSLLLSLEKAENKIEIVIHVNMLKEGWDVTNLYTIIPLRTAASLTLREQTIGRGLRLPYGVRCGIDKVDKLTIVAHDKFQEIIEEANKPGSIIKLQNIITIDNLDIDKPKEVVVSLSTIENRIQTQQTQIENIKEPEKKQEAINKIEADKVLLNVLNTIGLNQTVRSVSDLSKKEIKELVIEKSTQIILNDPQQNLFAEDRVREITERYAAVVQEFTDTIIEIPRITIQPKGDIKSGFRDFDLDTTRLNLQPSDEIIRIQYLREGKIETIDANEQKVVYDSIQNMIVNEVISYPEIDYDEQSELLFKMANQVIDKFRTYLPDENDIIRVVKQHKVIISDLIYTQMMEHFYTEMSEFETPIIDVKAFTRIEEHNYSKYSADLIRHYTDTITPTSLITSLIFTGFRKACHYLYKFDSKTEKDFTIILENDSAVVKWMRPAANQFKIYWRHDSQQYRPDFVVETVDGIYLVETKKQDDIKDEEVQEKARAAKEYCKYASDYNQQNGGKPWRYILIPHNQVLVNMNFGYFLRM